MISKMEPGGCVKLYSFERIGLTHNYPGQRHNLDRPSKQADFFWVKRI